MTPNERRLRLDLAAARYLEAIEHNDSETTSALWTEAAADPELAAVLRDVLVGLAEEQNWADLAPATEAIAAAAERYLPSATIVRPSGPVSVADVANEMYRHPPERLPAAAYELNERLRAASDLLPAELALSKLITWAEAKFGPAPAEYWQAFRLSALKLEMRRGSDVEYHLAARRAPKPEGSP